VVEEAGKANPVSNADQATLEFWHSARDGRRMDKAIRRIRLPLAGVQWLKAGRLSVDGQVTDIGRGGREFIEEMAV